MVIVFHGADSGNKQQMFGPPCIHLALALLVRVNCAVPEYLVHTYIYMHVCLSLPKLAHVLVELMLC